MQKIMVSHFFVLLFGAAAFAVPLNPKDTNDEYEMDLFMDYFLPEWNFPFLASPSGLRMTGGSLDIKRMYLEEELKVRFPFIPEKFWGRFRHLRQKTIDYENDLNEIEFEYSPVKKLFLSFLGTPEFNKYNADAGFAVRWAKDEGNGMKISYVLLDFDNNFAFNKTTTNIGFERFYRKTPSEWRLEYKTIDDSVKSRVYFVYDTKSDFDYEDLANPLNNYTQKNESYELTLNFLFDVHGGWNAGLDFNIRKNEESKMFTLMRLAENFYNEEKKYTLHPFIEKNIAKNIKIITGLSFVRYGYEISYPYFPSSSLGYERKNTGGFLLGFFELTKKSALEAGYMHDDVGWDDDSSGGFNRENRLKLGYEYKFGETTMMRFVTGWDLDREDWGPFAYFDGGHVQLQVLF